MVAELGSCQLIAPNTSPASSCVFPLISDGSPASQMSNPLTVLFDPSNFLSVHGKTAQASIPRDATDEKLNTINTQEVTSGWVNWKSVSIWGGGAALTNYVIRPAVMGCLEDVARKVGQVIIEIIFGIPV